MSAIFIALIAMAALGAALYPLFQAEGRPVRAPAPMDSTLENLLSAREAAYSAIKDLESDHAMGKLSAADYLSLRGKYEGKALAILQQLDAAQASLQADRREAAPDGACPHCGAASVPGAKFCRACGGPLASVCASCGAPTTADAKFCRRCGSPVAALQMM